MAKNFELGTGMIIIYCKFNIKYIIKSNLIISWFRKKDKTLLTVGLSTYSSDDRFFVEHTRHLGNWALRIKNAREDDEGLYECQISSHPPQSIFIELRIVEAVAEIIEAPDLHINEGYHEDRMVNYDVDDGITVSNTKLSSSVLTVRNATARHGGNYTCAPANARQASIYVHVLKGEKPAAMQHPDKTTSAATSSSSTLSAIHYILLPTISTAIYSNNNINNNTNRNNSTNMITFQFFIFNIMTGLLAVQNVLFKKFFYLYC
uniref:CSON012499 protein n=1 Tax=Culicoides sonorensis TaxID=179676 RepID=A0A336M5P2_CULSO